MDSDLVPKKRGRPRKSAEPNQTGQTESTAAVTRRTSTTSTRKVATAKAKPTKSKSTRATKSGAAVSDSSVASSKPLEVTEDSNVPGTKKQVTTPSSQANNQVNSKGVKSVSSAKVTTSSPASSRKDSRILQKLAANDVASSEKTPALETAPETARTASEASEEVPSTPTKRSPKPPPSNIAATKFSPSTHARAQAADPNAPPSLKQMNAYAVNSLSQHAHPSRPPPKIGQTKANIGPKYRSVARRVTTLMVALPIVGVTSWVLYDRLVLGNEPKSLIRVSPKVVED